MYAMILNHFYYTGVARQLLRPSVPPGASPGILHEHVQRQGNAARRAQWSVQQV